AENSYLSAIAMLCELASVDTLYAHDIERWVTTDDALRQHQLDDVFDGSAPVTEGERLSGSRLQNVIRRCMREVAWLELLVPRSFLVHLSHDLRFFVALEPDPAPARSRIRELGLFVYPGKSRLPTLEEWGFHTAD